MRLAVPALTLVDEAAERDQPLAPAEHGVEEDGDLLGVGVAAERVLGRWPVVEVHPRVEVQDAVVAHAGSLQQRSDHGQKRHSKKSGVVAMRGSKLARVGRLQDPHAPVGHALREIGVEGHQLVVHLGRVLVDRGEQRRARR